MSKNHDAIPIPDAQVYARAVGKLKWDCPNCGQSYPTQPMPWRRGDLRCERCHSKYQLGLGFSLQPMSDGFLMGKWDSYMTNRVEPTGTFYDGVKLFGTIQWQCPQCDFSEQSSFLDAFGAIRCICCNTVFYISALFWRLAKVSRLKLKAPMDSLIPKNKPNAQETIQSLPAEASSTRPGTPSRSPRGVS